MGVEKIILSNRTKEKAEKFKQEGFNELSQSSLQRLISLLDATLTPPYKSL